MAASTLNEIIECFFSLPSLTIPFEETKIDICPRTDLAFNQNEQCAYFYQAGLWRILDERDVKNGIFAKIVDKFLVANFPKISASTAKILEVKESIFRNVERSFSTDRPSPYIVFDDKTMDFHDFTLHEFNRSHFAIYHFPFSSASITSPTPVFDAYLERTFTDPVDRETVIDMFAYYLIPFDAEPAFFYLYGPPRTGKSKLMNLITALVGNDFVSSFSLQSLTTYSATVAELAGKKLNALDEDESDRIASDKFKALLDHSKTEARRLYQPPFSFRPHTKFIFSSNQLPKFQNIEGLERRIHILAFENVITIGEQDKFLDAKLAAEIPGIVGKAIEAAKAFLARNGEFIDSQSSMEAKTELLMMVAPSRMFVRDCCNILDPFDFKLAWASNQVLYNAYVNWCKESGHKPLSSQNFHRQVATFPSIVCRKSDDERKKNLSLKVPAMGDTQTSK